MKKLKEGNCWKACFDQKHNKYLGRIVCTNREGQTRELYEITGEVFNRLGSFPDDYDNECLIRTGKLLFRFEDTMYGTLGPVNTVYDDSYTESDWYEAYKSLTQNDAMTNLEKCNAGIEYSYADEELIALKTEAIRQCEIFNAIDGRDYMAQYRHLQQMLGAVGERVWIAKTFNCDRGKNIFIGDDFTGNHNLTILDIREVYIGNHVMIGPNTLITTVGHPLSPKGRREYHALAKSVRIGNDVWIGGNVTILPGVTIGNNVVVAAGAVINKDVPDNTLVGGVPARVIKTIEDDI